MRRFATITALTAAVLAGCGSTVPVAQQGTAPLGEGPTQLGTSAPTDSQPGAATVPAGGSTSVSSPAAGRGGAVPGPAAIPGERPGTPGPVAGQPRVTTPVVIGMVLTDTGNAAALGISPGNTFTERQLDDALVGALNKHGGLNGRHIKPVYAKTDTGSANWETDFAAACATMTQDNHVAVVLGFVFNYSAAFERCLASHAIPHLSEGFNIPDNTELRPYPLHRALIVPTIGRRTLAKLGGALATGALTSKNNLGFLTDTCPGTQRSLNDVVTPYANKHALHIVKTISFNCVNGNADNGNAVSAIQSAVLAFAAAGVDRVVIHGVSEAGPTLLFASTAESQNYHPQYLVSSLAQMAALGSEIPAGQVKNIHAFGWMPTQDVSPASYPKLNASQTRCLALLKSEGIVPSSAVDYFGAFEMCEGFFLYERALQAIGGVATGAAVTHAVDQLGTTFLSSITLGGTSRYRPGLTDAVLTARPLDYSADCSCFVYTGPARPIPDL